MEDARRSLERLEPIERETSSDDERHFLVRVLPYRTLDDRIHGVVMTFIDITKRKKAEQRLSESELRFRTFFESRSDAMFVYDIDEQEQPETFDAVNSSAAKLLRYSADELTSMTLSDLVDDTDDFDFDEHIAALVEEGEVLEEARSIRCWDWPGSRPTRQRRS